MWSGWVAHWFGLKREDMVNVTLSEYMAMYDSIKQG